MHDVLTMLTLMANAEPVPRGASETVAMTLGHTSLVETTR